MKYRLDSVRKNKTRLKRRFLSSPAQKKAPVRRKKKINWVVPLLLLLCAASFLTSAYLYTRPNVIEHKTIIHHAQPTIPLIPPLEKVQKPKVVIKKEKKKARECYYARRGATYYTECK